MIPAQLQKWTQGCQFKLLFFLFLFQTRDKAELQLMETGSLEVLTKLL